MRESWFSTIRSWRPCYECRHLHIIKRSISLCLFLSAFNLTYN